MGKMGPWKGTDLRALYLTRPFSGRRLLVVASSLAQLIAYLHREQVIVLNWSPANIIMGDEMGDG